MPEANAGKSRTPTEATARTTPITDGSGEVQRRLQEKEIKGKGIKR